MLITKSNGERVPFNERKLRSSLARTGAKQPMIDHILANVKQRLHKGSTTKELYRIVTQELRKEARHIGHRYHLRTGLLKLGPAGFKFEKYVASILAAYGYVTTIPEKEIRGYCVKHELDVIAEKSGKRVVIEAKFRNDFNDDVDLKDTMATYARYLDLLDGGKAGTCDVFHQLWIVTNGRFSDRAHQFGVCKGIRMVSWNGPKEHSLAAMVDHAALYPITVLENLRSWELDNLATNDLMLCREVAHAKPASLAKKVGMDIGRAEKMIRDCKMIIGESVIPSR